MDNIVEFFLSAFSMALGLKFCNLSYLDSKWFGRNPSKELSSLHDLYFGIATYQLYVGVMQFYTLMTELHNIIPLYL